MLEGGLHEGLGARAAIQRANLGLDFTVKLPEKAKSAAFLDITMLKTFQSQGVFAPLTL